MCDAAQPSEYRAFICSDERVFAGEPGSLSVSARGASSPLLRSVLLNARMRSIRDSGLQRLQEHNEEHLGLMIGALH